MDIFDKIIKFLDENDDELKEAIYGHEYMGMIDKWHIMPEDQLKFENLKIEMKGPQHQLSYILFLMRENLKGEILAFKNDKRSREEKYDDSLKEALKNEKFEISLREQRKILMDKLDDMLNRLKG